jgi:transmembrane sensor
MKRERISYLLKQFIDGALSQDESQELFIFLEKDNHIVQSIITRMLEQQSPGPLSETEHWKDMLEKIMAIDKPAGDELLNEPHKQRFSFFRWAAVAALVLLTTAGGYLLLNSRPAVMPVRPVAQVIPPGGNKAVLTLANGSKIVLDSAQNGELLLQGGASVNKTGNGQLAYHPSAGNPEAEVVYNMLSTPKSGQFKLILSDGTRVWLNAASSIKYFTSFSGGPRKVELTGEAYFEVAKKGKDAPFLVTVNGTQIAVLGTHFNVMAYNDEPDMKTTLLEGSVMLSLAGNKQLLKPGQQAQVPLRKTGNGPAAGDENVAASGKIKVVDIPETAGVIAWKEGNFIFEGEPIQSIMRKLSRWYDLEVSYKGSVTREGFNGTISRFEPASEVLKMLELTGLLHFKVEGRRITVMP